MAKTSPRSSSRSQARRPEPAPQPETESPPVDAAAARRAANAAKAESKAEKSAGDLAERINQTEGMVNVNQGELIVFTIGQGWRLAKLDDQAEPEKLTKNTAILAETLAPFRYDAESLAAYHSPNFKIIKRYSVD